MPGFGQIFRARPEKDAGRRLYAEVVAQARHPHFYSDLGVPDTATGRFDLIVLHSFLVLNRLKGDVAGGRLAQALCDAVVEDMDRNLREMGTGDLSVGRKVRRLMEGFYGRIGAYEEALQSGDDALISVLMRNLYASAGARDAASAALARYMRREAAALLGRSIAELSAGVVGFGPPPPGAGEETGT